MAGPYVHGYDERANERLRDQAADARRSAPPRHRLPGRQPGARGGLRRRRPDADAGASAAPRREIISIDVSAESLAEAARRVEAAGVAQRRVHAGGRVRAAVRAGVVRPRLRLLPARARRRGRSRRSRPSGALLRPGGTITVIEGDHGSAYFHPDSEAAHDAIRCQVELQRGGRRRREHRPPRLSADDRGRLRRRPVSRRARCTSTPVAPRARRRLHAGRRSRR